MDRSEKRLEKKSENRSENGFENRLEKESLLHPSVLQIRYLLELEKLGKRRGSVAAIANTCGVSHGPVSRFFKECMGHGYLTESCEFTETGRRALNVYKKIFREVETYLGRIGVSREDIPDRLQQLVENVDYELLFMMTQNAKTEKKPMNRTQSEDEQAYYLEKLLDRGRAQVGIAIHQLRNPEGIGLSMANRGFEHRAAIRNNTRGQWLELTIREMHARSRIDGREMTGHLSALKYEHQGRLFEAKIKDGRIRIPLTAFRFIRSGHGNVKGVIPITVTCSVGEAHMPESTALLTFWM